MNTKQILLTSVIIGVVCALLVWWLEGFERKRLAKDWQSFVDGWSPSSTPGEATP